MQEMSVIWLRVAAVFYSLGLLYALLTFLHKRSERVFRVALGSFYTGVVLQVVSTVEQAVAGGRFPANDFFESDALCALLIGLLFLFVYWRYRYESLAVFIFPLVFVMTLVGSLAGPTAAWSNPQLRDAWLLVHVVLVLIGYATLLFTAVTSILYLIRERQLKIKADGRGVQPPAAARHTGFADVARAGDRFRVDHGRGRRGEHLGLDRVGHALDPRPTHRDLAC